MSAFAQEIDRSNQPSGKSTQTYYFTSHYEAKHAIGKQHNKRIDFASRPGISSVESLCDKFYHTRESPKHFGRFVISGKPASVDALMKEIKEWLRTCQSMHQTNIMRHQLGL